MKITRREFLPAFAAFAATLPALASAHEPDNEETPQTTTNTLEKHDSSLVKTLRFIDPNLSGMIINLSYYFSEPIIFHKINYKKLKNDDGNITEADIIHNNSDRWANAISTTISYFIAYSARLPFTLWVANDSRESTADIKRQNKVFSDFMTMNIYYSQTFVDRYLTNAFQHELREAYKKILKEKLEYKYQPWAIPLSEVFKILHNISPSVKSAISKDIKTNAKRLKALTDKQVPIDWIKSRRNQLDLLLIFLSYVGTFVDIIPLLTRNKVQAYTANTATGRLLGNFPCQAVLTKDLLKKLKDKGDIEGYNEEKVMSIAGLYNSPSYYIINSAIQSFFDSTLNLKKYSDSDVAYSNAREFAGAIIGSIIFMFLQYKLESSIRSNMKDSNKGATKESLFTQFANWYIEPDSMK